MVAVDDFVLVPVIFMFRRLIEYRVEEDKRMLHETFFLSTIIYLLYHITQFLTQPPPRGMAPFIQVLIIHFFGQLAVVARSKKHDLVLLGVIALALTLLMEIELPPLIPLEMFLFLLFGYVNLFFNLELHLEFITLMVALSVLVWKEGLFFQLGLPDFFSVVGYLFFLDLRIKNMKDYNKSVRLSFFGKDSEFEADLIDVDG